MKRARRKTIHWLSRLGLLPAGVTVRLLGLRPVAGGDHMADVLAKIDASLGVLAERKAGGERLSADEDARLADGVEKAKNTRTKQPYVTEDASDRRLDELHTPTPGARGKGGRDTRGGMAFLRDVKAARRGDPEAFGRAAGRDGKGWVEGTPSAGGFLVSPDVLPGYVEVMAAAAPLRARCSEHSVGGDEVWVTVEGNPITVAHTAEAASKPSSTGTVAQKISTVHKVAGVTSLSDELLADSDGVAAQLVQAQFGKQIGKAIDTAIHSGTGTGQPVGIRNATGVSTLAVDGQGGKALADSVLKAVSRIVQRGEPVDTVAMHPRDAVKFTLAIDSTGRYVFEEGLERHLPTSVQLVLDATLPANLGAGTNESVILVGGFRRGAYLFSRQPLTIEASPDAGWTTDETVFRGVERYGFAVTVPGAFEVLTGITP